MRAPADERVRSRAEPGHVAEPKRASVRRGLTLELGASPPPVADPARVGVFLLGAIFVLDAIWSAVLSGSGAFLNAVMDEPAHLATCGICLLALAGVAGRLPTRLFIVAALVGSTAIDLDHVPGFLGSQALTAGTSRPYGHTLLTLAILLALAALIRRPAGRTILLALAFGLSTHLVRDMATGDGVALLWPLSDGSARIPYLAYAAVLCGLVVLVALSDRRPWGFSRPSGRGG